MRLFTVSVDSEDVTEGEWNDLLYVAANSYEQADMLATQWVRDHRQTVLIGNVEAYEYGGSAKVLASFQPDEEES